MNARRRAPRMNRANIALSFGEGEPEGARISVKARRELPSDERCFNVHDPSIHPGILLKAHPDYLQGM